MKSILLTVLVMLFVQVFALGSDSYDKISDVFIEGNKNVKSKTIRNRIKSKSGKMYSEEKVTSDIQSILELGSFENVEVALDTSTMRLTFKVIEKPFIKTIVFKGNKKISQRRLKSEITLKDKDYFDHSKFDESKEKVLSLYHDKGYSDCKIEVYPTTDEVKREMTLNYLISEGNRILISEINLSGVVSYKQKKILKLMKTKKKKPYNEEKIREDIKAIEAFYKNNGYVDVKIADQQIELNAERTLMSITVPVSEGPKFKVGNISFSGNSIFNAEDLNKDLQIKSGQIYNEEKLQESRFLILEFYSDKGYLHSQITPEFFPDTDNGKMDIVFSINEGTIVYLRNIFIDGLGYTKDFVIRREIMLKEGDVFSSAKVRRSIEKIYNLGFIDGVEPQIQPTQRFNEMDLALNITEGKPGILSAGAGYSSVDQLVGTLQVQHINLLGRAQRLNLLWEFGARKQSYEIDWTEPWLLNKPLTLGVGIFNTERNRDYGTIFSAYKEARKGGSVRIGPRLSDFLSLLFSYSYEDIKVFDIDSTITSNVLESHDITSSVSSQIIWDNRDNIFDATRGNRQSLSVQVAGGPLGGDVNFIKPIGKSSWYFPTFWKFILSFNATIGVVESYPPSVEVPIYERFYVGGAETVRGYQYRSEIGPEEGGKVMSVLNVEYKFPLVQERNRTILQGAFFADFGGSWLGGNDINLRFGSGQNDLKAGVGFGIRFTTPVFPLRLDWGYGLNHKPGEEVSQFYFTIGNIF